MTAHYGVAAADAAVLWTQVAVLLLLARVLGVAVRRLGQPPIIGSLLAGVVAGPSVFGHLWPGGFHWFRPGTQLHAGLLAAVADFSLLVLLIVLGAETDLRLIRRLGRSASSVTAGSLVLPLAGGAAVAWILPTTFHGPHSHRISFVLLIAASMAVSSLPVIARIMSETGLTRRDVGQLSIAAATVNDGVGFLALAAAVGLVGGGAGKLLIAAAAVAGLVVLLPTIGQRAIDVALRSSRRRGPDIGAGIAICVIFTIIVAAVAQALGVDAALGAFLAGMVIGRSRFLAPRVLHTLESMSDGVFAPLYFASAGISVDVTLLREPSVLEFFGLVVVVAVSSKFLAVYAAARIADTPRREAAALGVALNGRGALQVILATAGITAGVISPRGFTIIILLSILSSIAVPPTLRWLMRGWAGTENERERLAHEHEMATNIVVRGGRLLLPSRGSTNSVAAARVLDLAWPDVTEVTLLRLNSTDEVGIDNVRAMFAARDVREEAAGADNVIESILAEANLGYGAIGIGAAEPTGGESLPPWISELLNRAPIPVVLVRRGQTPTDGAGRPFIRPRRILVPLTGSAASRAGQEVAETISRNTGADLTLLHVVTRSDDRAATTTGRQSGTAVVEEARRNAQDKNLAPAVVVRDAASSADEIARETNRTGADVVVVGTTVRRVNDHPFLGHTIDHLLEHVSQPTVVVVVLPDTQQMAAGEHVDRDAG